MGALLSAARTVASAKGKDEKKELKLVRDAPTHILAHTYTHIHAHTHSRTHDVTDSSLGQIASNVSALMGSLASAVKEERRQHLAHARNLLEKDIRRLALILASDATSVRSRHNLSLSVCDGDL